MSALRRLAWGGAALAGLALGCRGEPPRAAPADAAGGLSAAPSAARPNPRFDEPAWRRARGDDPLDLIRLAELEGAAGLMAAVREGGDAARLALLALPHADDADLALRELSDRARSAAPRAVRPLLVAILGIAGRPRDQREAMDPDGARAAGAAMIELAAPGRLPPAERALAISVARALAEKGYADAARIPRDLDPVQ